MAQIKIDGIIYGSSNASDIIYKNITVEEKLDAIPIFDINDNGNVILESDMLTYGHIINTLDSDATDKVLSAKQGKILNEKFDNIDFSALENDINLNRESIDLLNEAVDMTKADIKTNETAIKNLNNQVNANTNNINILNNNPITCKYNPDTDYISILLNGTWVDVVHAGAIDPQPLIPVLTGDASAGIGMASCGNNFNTSAAYIVFDGNDSTRTEYSIENVNNGWIQYEFYTPIELKKVMMRALSVGKIFDYHFQYWDSFLSTWVTFAEGTSSYHSTNESQKETFIHSLEKTIKTNKIKMYTTTTKSNGNNLYLYTIQVYGRYT